MTEKAQLKIPSKTDPDVFSVRDITENDLPAVRDLYDMSLKLNARGFIQQNADNPLPDIGDMCCQFQTENGAMQGLFTDNGILVGFGGLCCNKKDPVRVELCKLHLNPAFQGRGLGRSLVEKLMERAKSLNYKIIELHVTATQQAAIGLYVRLGFVQTKREVYTAPSGTEYDTIYMERDVDKEFVA